MKTWPMSFDVLHRLCGNDHAMIRWIYGVKLSDDPSMADLLTSFHLKISRNRCLRLKLKKLSNIILRSTIQGLTVAGCATMTGVWICVRHAPIAHYPGKCPIDAFQVGDIWRIVNLKIYRNSLVIIQC